jgi:hypothetical protein
LVIKPSTINTSAFRLGVVLYSSTQDDKINSESAIREEIEKMYRFKGFFVIEIVLEIIFVENLKKKIISKDFNSVREDSINSNQNLT